MIDKIANPVQVANAYASGLKTAMGGGADDAAGGVNFGDLLKAGLGNAVDTLKSGEKMSAAAVAGKADLNDVVQAVTSAEMTLQTVVAVRDRLVGAYQDIMRMPI